MSMEQYRAMLGAFVGDAAGAALEFMGIITPEMARHAMTMPGGGLHKVGPGQITDDGELTLAAWQHIMMFRDGFGIPRTNLMRAYVMWYRSAPFDMGNTCRYAFKELSKAISLDNPLMPINCNMVDEFEKKIQTFSGESEANGALMRATALATWCSLLWGEHYISIYESIAELDAMLSHPSLVCQEVNKVYVLTLVYLLYNYSPEETLEHITEYVNEKVTSEKVKKWFFEESLSIDDLDCKINEGHVRYGFVMAIHFLRNPEIGYEEAIYRTLLKGGDTDTNACIVGGLVACYQPIPEFMLKPVLEFDCTKEGQIRPKQYSVKRLLNGDLLQYVKELYDMG